MKRIIFLFAILSFFASCDEIPPTINPVMDPVDTPLCEKEFDVSEQRRNVVIEEFTGVGCNNCPAGSREIEDLLAQHGERLCAISIHSSGSFSVPLDESQFDFRTQEGDDILNLLGQPLGYPTAVINRKGFSGGFGLQLGQTLWVGAISDELSLDPRVKIGLASEYDEDNRSLEVCVAMFPQEDITEDDVRLTVMITESGIIDAQKDNEQDPELVLNYEHKHLFRTTLTASSGNKYTEDLSAGAEIRKSFQLDFPQDWNAAKSEIIAFVSLGGDDKEVLQVVCKPLGE